MKKILTVALLVATFGMFCSAPAVEAGTLFLKNDKEGWYCHAGFLGYIFGIPFDAATVACTSKGEMNWKNIWTSIGFIQVVCWESKKDCEHHPDDASTSHNMTWSPTDTWLPSNHYRATVNSNGTFSFERTW